MPKANILDRIAKDLDVLKARKFQNRNQRIASAQRWNSLSDIANKGIERLPEFKAGNPFLNPAPSFDEDDLRLLAYYTRNAAGDLTGDDLYYAKKMYEKIHRYLDDLDAVRGPARPSYIDD